MSSHDDGSVPADDVSRCRAMMMEVFREMMSAGVVSGLAASSPCRVPPVARIPSAVQLAEQTEDEGDRSYLRGRLVRYLRTSGILGFCLHPSLDRKKGGALPSSGGLDRL